MGQHAPAREDDRGGLRPRRRTDFSPDDDAWMDMYAHDLDPRDPAIEGVKVLKAASFAPKTDEDWLTPTESVQHAVSFFLFPFSTCFLPGGHVHGGHPVTQGLHPLPARRRLCLPMQCPTPH
jgi:hypothetical protein